MSVRIDRLNELIRETKRMIRFGKDSLELAPVHRELIGYSIQSMEGRLRELEQELRELTEKH